MLGVGLGVRQLVAAAPAPPVLGPPGKPLLPLSSSLRRRSSSWWFSSGNAHERDSAAASTSRREARRKWWSDPEPNQQEYGYSSLEDEEEEEDYEDEDEAGFPGLGGPGELFDEPWFSKVFKTYGFLLPVMLVSMFAATGPKAFLMAMAIPLGQSAISFLLDAIWGRRRSNRDDRWRRPFQEEEDYPDDTTDFATGGRGNRYSSSRSYNEGRRKQYSYQSWVSNDFAGAASDDDNSTKSSSSQGGEGKKSSGNFGGWDEILNDDNVATQEKRRSSFSTGNTDYSKRPQPAVTGEEDTKGYAAGRGAGQGLGAPPARTRMRQRRGMPKTAGLGRTRYKQAPLLMRLLVAVFPFMGSWFRLL
ncbi:unnamed protein product [Urochloa decumbens]|uniref:Uncharacterized protein n=1 Tax=Urochloa decumbens TaxID=240449 RepID=A0ABC8YVF2_9POAL